MGRQRVTLGSLPHRGNHYLRNEIPSEWNEDDIGRYQVVRARPLREDGGRGVWGKLWFGITAESTPKSESSFLGLIFFSLNIWRISNQKNDDDECITNHFFLQRNRNHFSCIAAKKTRLSSRPKIPKWFGTLSLSPCSYTGAFNWNPLLLRNPSGRNIFTSVFFEIKNPSLSRKPHFRVIFVGFFQISK